MGAPTLTWHEVDYSLDENDTISSITISDTPVNTTTNRLDYSTTQVATPSIVRCVIGKFTWGYGEPATSAASNIKFWLYSKSTDSENTMKAGWSFYYGYIPYSSIDTPSKMPKFKDFSENVRKGLSDFTDISGSSLKMLTLNEFEPNDVDTNLSANNFFVYNNGTSYTPYIFVSIMPSYQQGDGFVSGWTYRGSYIYR